jgi:endonuclease/exonuclease/phosphatase family metal-dependent hydrolase
VTSARLRVMSYNIRNGRGSDGRIDLPRIAAVIASFRPEIVALQEVDVGRARTGAIDQAHELASRLGMSARFACCVEHGCERYGIATLTTLPVLETRELALPALPGKRGSQPRRALVTRLAWPDPATTLIMLNTHLSTVGAERPLQVAALATELAAETVVVAGDLNCLPWSSPFKALCGHLRSATGRARSWPARAPLFPIDHILVRGPLAVLEGGSWVAPGARRASDHLPVVAVLAEAA